MRRYSEWIGAGLICVASAAVPQSQAAASETLSAEQSKILDLLERGARHVLQTGEHVPVTALVMRPSGEIELVDLEQSFADQGEALKTTVMHLVPMAKGRQIKALGIMFQPGNAGEKKPPILTFNLEQAGRPRVFVSLTYRREGGTVSFGPKTFVFAPAKLLAD